MFILCTWGCYKKQTFFTLESPLFHTVVLVWFGSMKDIFPTSQNKEKNMPFLKIWMTFIYTNKWITYLRNVSPVFTLACENKEQILESTWSRFRSYTLELSSTHSILYVCPWIFLNVGFYFFFQTPNSLKNLLSPLPSV